MTTQLNRFIANPDYMNALYLQMKAEMAFKTAPKFGAYQVVKTQYQLSGSRKNVLSQFNSLIEETKNANK